MAIDINARIAALQTARPRACNYYDLPFRSGGQKIRLLHLHPTRYRQGAPANPPTVPIQGPEGLERIPALSELFGALFISGVHGLEEWAPEFLMDVAELLAAAIDAIQAGNPPAPFQVPGPPPSGGYSLTSDEVKAIVEKLDLFFVPVVCPWGRINSSRTNQRTVDLNRNFPFLWKRHHDSNDYYNATVTPQQVDANQPGTSAASEVETQAVVALLYALPVNVFVDCHARMRGSATYPWACEGTQTTDKTKSAFQYDPADATTIRQADGVVGGSGYDEFLPSGTKANLATAGAAIAGATGLTTPGIHLPGWSHGHSIAALPYIGVSDDFAMSLDICRMLTFTFEIVESNAANRPGAAGQYQSAIMALLNWYTAKVVAGSIDRPIARPIPKGAQEPPENWDGYRSVMACIPNFEGSGTGSGGSGSGGSGSSGSGTGSSGSGGAGSGAGSTFFAAFIRYSIIAVILIVIAIILFYFVGVIGPQPPASSATSYALDHYKVYDVRDVPLMGEEGPGRPVFTEGQFDGGPKPGTLLAVTHFSTPVLKTLPGDTASTLINERAHLTWYELEETEEDPRRRVTFTNQFGEDQVIVIHKALYLLLPTTKLLNRPPDTVPDDLDHFKCYEVIETTDVDAGQMIDIEDQFGVDEDVVVGDPALFCVPANKFLGLGDTGPGLLNAEDHLMVYEIPPTRGPIPPFKTKDQFQDYPGFVVIETAFLCVPSKKVAFENLPPVAP